MQGTQDVGDLAHVGDGAEQFGGEQQTVGERERGQRPALVVGERTEAEPVDVRRVALGPVGEVGEAVLAGTDQRRRLAQSHGCPSMAARNRATAGCSSPVTGRPR